MRFHLLIFLLSACAGLAHSAQAAETAKQAGDRFTVRAHFEPAPHAASDGRFTLSASARLAGSDGQRFLVQSLAGSCAAASDLIFQDGLEPAIP